MQHIAQYRVSMDGYLQWTTTSINEKKKNKSREKKKHVQHYLIIVHFDRHLVI